MLQLEPFDSRVADFYRLRGYQVTQGARVRGESGNVYTVPMVADGPMGALLVSFGDAAGIDGEEIARVRTMGRDIGATPVICAPDMPLALRRLAAQMAVVVLDGEVLGEPAVVTAPKATPVEPEIHPWPDSGRARPIPDAGATRAVDVDEMLANVLGRGLSVPALHEPTIPASEPQPIVQPVVGTAQRPFAWLGQTPGVAVVEASRPASGLAPAAPPHSALALDLGVAEYHGVVAARMPITRHTVRKALWWGGAGALAVAFLFWMFG